MGMIAVQMENLAGQTPLEKNEAVLHHAMVEADCLYSRTRAGLCEGCGNVGRIGNPTRSAQPTDT